MRIRITVVILLIGIAAAIGLRTLRDGRDAEVPPRSSSDTAMTAQHAGTIAYGETAVTLAVGSISREYVLYVPQSYTGEAGVPLVIGYHGGGGTANGFMAQTKLPEAAERYGFIVAFPEGYRARQDQPANFSRNPQAWNDGSGKYAAGKMNIDDVAFTRALIADVSGAYRIDSRRIYATGFSMGGSMVLRLGIELSDTLAAIAVASTGGFRSPSTTPSRSVPFAYTQGDSDPDFVNTIQGVQKESPEVTVERFAVANGCGTASAVVPYVPTVTKTTYAGCPAGMEAIYYLIERMGHAWPGGEGSAPKRLVGETSYAMNATEVFWKFFETHPL